MPSTDFTCDLPGPEDPAALMLLGPGPAIACARMLGVAGLDAAARLAEARKAGLGLGRNVVLPHLSCIRPYVQTIIRHLYF
jgi:hypothetical protein